MTTKLLISVFLCAIIGACSSEYEKAGTRQAAGESMKLKSVSQVSVHGVLWPFPQGVKSVEAWLGHEYMVGDTPIKPTTAVPTEQLLDLLGKTVMIEGSWNPGKEWEPANEEVQSPRPIFPKNEAVIRGSGIEASKIIRADG